jgi:homoserine O-succinyltransferase
MPLDLEPFRSLSPLQTGAGRDLARKALVIGLINNMPDTALEATEGQFLRLLGAATDTLAVRLRLSSLPEVPRGSAGLERINNGTYWPIDELLREPLDALIVTGMEPRAPLLSDEPYWDRFGQILHWADANTTSSIWSCLAAHAAVEHLDGIQRRRLERKRCGVYEHETLREHPLLDGLGPRLSIPHSRWNELPAQALRDAGYTLASASLENGADLFTKQQRSLLVFFQGHPEYEEATLLKEYRRDVGRFLRREQPHYPSLPHGYFPTPALEILQEFESRALAAPSLELFADFPGAAVAATLSNTWSADASRIYRNWLALLAVAQPAGTSPPSNKLSESRL